MDKSVTKERLGVIAPEFSEFFMKVKSFNFFWGGGLQEFQSFSKIPEQAFQGKFLFPLQHFYSN